MTLSYWYCRHQTDSDCYSIRTLTRREALLEIAENGVDFEPKGLCKVTVEYESGFDLMLQCLSEGGLYEEANLVRVEEE